MCRIITKRRLEYYKDPHYDKKPLYKPGDIVWLYQEPLGKGTGVWLVYEAKIRKPLTALQYQFDTFLQLGANMPVYDVELPWTSDPDVSSDDDDVQFIGPPVMRPIYEIHLFNPKTILVDEMFCSIGENNVNVLYGLSEAKKRKIPKEGLVFLGRSQSAEVRKYLERTGQNEHANCDTDLESDGNAESEPDDKAYRAGQNKPSDVWKGHGKKRKRRSKHSSADSSPPKPRVTFSTEKSVMDNGVIVRVKEEPEDSPPPRREPVHDVRKRVFGGEFLHRYAEESIKSPASYNSDSTVSRSTWKKTDTEDTDSDSSDHVLSSSMFNNGPSTSSTASSSTGKMKILARKSCGPLVRRLPSTK